ncbi:MAG: hypothetical protein K2N35_03725, partial [Muribaculaceae bacterium]|nr:hypothetical protein [Muribaculaceae bacterium]
MSAATSTPSSRNISKSTLPTSKSGASSEQVYRCTTAPGEAVGQFPDERSELGKQGYVSGLLFLRKRTPKLRSPRCSLLSPL